MIVVVVISWKCLDKGRKPTTALQLRVFGFDSRAVCTWLYPCCNVNPFIYKALSRSTTTTRRLKIE